MYLRSSDSIHHASITAQGQAKTPHQLHLMYPSSNKNINSSQVCSHEEADHFQRQVSENLKLIQENLNRTIANQAKLLEEWSKCRLSSQVRNDMMSYYEDPENLFDQQKNFVNTLKDLAVLPENEKIEEDSTKNVFADYFDAEPIPLSECSFRREVSDDRTCYDEISALLDMERNSFCPSVSMQEHGNPHELVNLGKSIESSKLDFTVFDASHQLRRKEDMSCSNGAVSKKKRNKKPKDMPRRPLSAYNIFFRDQRSLILKDIPGQSELGYSDENLEKKKVAHGKISFEHLAKSIGKRWKEVTPNEREFYKASAAKEMARYKNEMAIYKKSKSVTRAIMD